MSKKGRVSLNKVSSCGICNLILETNFQCKFVRKRSDYNTYKLYTSYFFYFESSGKTIFKNNTGIEYARTRNFIRF